MAVARMAFAMMAPALRASAVPAFPFPDAAMLVDLDFVNRRYWWGGAAKLEANFTTFALNGSTFSSRGLAPTDTIDVTLALTGLGTFTPGSFACGFYNLAAPSGSKYWFQLDDATDNNRVSAFQAVSLTTQCQVLVANASQAAINTPGLAFVPTLNVRHGCALAWATNRFDLAANGVGASPDTSGTVPSPTVLRILKRILAASSPTGTGILSRLVLFGAAKPLAELQTLSLQLRNEG